MPDRFRQVPGAILGTLFLLALLAAPPLTRVAVANQPSAGAPLSLSEALARTLLHSPELAAFSEEVRARDAEALQAGIRLNPSLSFEVENILGSGEFSGTDGAETTLTLSQAIELGNKRSRRRELAEAETAVAQSDYHVAQIEALARTTDSFVAALAAQQRLQLAEELAALAKQILGHVEERIAAGKTAANESIRVRIQWRDLEIAREKASRNLAAARRTLAARMGLAAAEFGHVAGDLSHLADLPDLTELERSIDTSPQIARRTAETARRRRAVELESTKRYPDLEVALGVRYLRESEDTALVAGLSVPLPLFDRNQGAVAAARSRLNQARAEERNALVQAKAAVSTAWQEMAAAQAEAAALQNEILPAAREALEAADYGYRAGKFGILDVLDAQRTLVEARGRHLDALAVAHRAANELNRQLGVGLPENRQPAPVSVKE